MRTMNDIFETLTSGFAIVCGLLEFILIVLLNTGGKAQPVLNF